MRRGRILLVLAVFTATSASVFAQVDTQDADRDESKRVVYVQRLNNGRIVLVEDPLVRLEALGLSMETSDRSSADTNAWLQLQIGVKHWNSLQKSKAISEWKSVVQHYPDSEPAFAALVNLGHAFRDAGKTDSAIRSYRAAIDMELPQSSDRKHYVCVYVSHAHLERKNLTDAIKYARLARFTYRPFNFCSICSDWDEARIDRYIDQIQTAIDEQRPTSLENVDEWNDRWDSEVSAAATTK